eukprot:TRINITY_DN10837_c0_g1_i1.p1 TRINITY_DN10837_c0_g1~~TRINITY_DN10837_c0_g1_i1.p1  ORF type:complete len:197 (+),score=48.92 TRINITY_DN10837_c0_g1_i1:342-932(+)
MAVYKMPRTDHGCKLNTKVKKAPDLLDQVSVETDAWMFLLRVSEKGTFAKQVWETMLLLLDSPGWSSSFASQEKKGRLNLGKATSRDASLVADLCTKALASKAVVEIADLIVADVASGLDPAICTALTEALDEAALESEVGRLIAERAAAGPSDEGQRKVVAPSGSSKVGKEDGLPVYVCEGISGSHQKMDIKKGL